MCIRDRKYSDLLNCFLLDFAKSKENSTNGLVTFAIIDKEQHHYQAMIRGVDVDTEIYSCDILFHFDIIDDKIWFQCNYTDLLIEDELLKLGIPKSDIVFGWLPEYAREHSGWGVGEKAA